MPANALLKMVIVMILMMSKMMMTMTKTRMMAIFPMTKMCDRKRRMMTRL